MKAKFKIGAPRGVTGYWKMAAAYLVFPALVALMATAALADRGTGSIRAAARPAPAPRAPAQQQRPEPQAHPTPHPAPEAHPPEAHPPQDHPDVHAAPPPHAAAPVRRDWDDNDADTQHGGGIAHGSPVRIARGQHFHDLPHHVSITFNNQTYFCDDDGNYYLQQGQDYVVVQPPVGAVVAALPPGVETVVEGPTTYYYLDGIYYVAQDDSFAVVSPPPGIEVQDLPDGATQVIVNGNVEYQFNGFNYQPSIQDGVTVYTVNPM